MPAYNAASFIRDAIESILGQSWTNFELLIYDDASTDDTVNIIESFRDKRFSTL
jgi:glycosyltransferase involved in cell wall biosynthesis